LGYQQENKTWVQ